MLKQVAERDLLDAFVHPVLPDLGKILKDLSRHPDIHRALFFGQFLDLLHQRRACEKLRRAGDIGRRVERHFVAAVKLVASQTAGDFGDKSPVFDQDDLVAHRPVLEIPSDFRLESPPVEDERIFVRFYLARSRQSRRRGHQQSYKH